MYEVHLDLHILFSRQELYTLFYKVCWVLPPSGNIIITGHESPLIIGVPQNITCTWSGEMNVSKMEWFVAGLHALPVKSEINSSTVILSPDPNNAGLAGTMFTCRATTANGSMYEETITLEVKGHHCMSSCMWILNV